MPTKTPPTGKEALPGSPSPDDSMVLEFSGRPSYSRISCAVGCPILNLQEEKGIVSRRTKRSNIVGKLTSDPILKRYLNLTDRGT